MLVPSYSDTHNLSRHIAWCGCHERSDQSRSSQGYMGWCGCHEIFIALGFSEEVSSRYQKGRNSTAIFYLVTKRNGQWRQWNTNWGHKKIYLDDWKLRCGYPWMLVNGICLCFSLFLWSLTWNLIVVDSSPFKIEEFLHQMTISFPESKSWTAKPIFPCVLNWMRGQFSLFTLTPE